MESNIVEIYVDPTTKSILEYIPALGEVLGRDDLEALPEDAIFVVQINIDETIERAKVSKKAPLRWSVLDEDDGYHD
jgi:hypothetical protein